MIKKKVLYEIKSLNKISEILETKDDENIAIVAQELCITLKQFLWTCKSSHVTEFRVCALYVE